MYFRARIDKGKVRQRMEAKGIENFGDLAKTAEEIGERTLYRVLDSHTWTSATLHALADALGCSPFDVLSVDAVSEKKEKRSTLEQEIAAICAEIGLDRPVNEIARQCAAMFKSKYRPGTIVTRAMVRECVEQIAKQQTDT